MRFGVSLFITDESDGPAELAALVEEFGFESFWLPEHSHVPVASSGSLSREYYRLYDAFMALANAAAVTTRLRLGTAVTVLSIRDPIWTSKMVATLDRLSNGRFDFGVGYGWIDREIENHGVPFRERREVFRDKLRIIRALWTNDVASHEGSHVSLQDSFQWPKPVQEPHPPIYLGAGLGPRTLDDIVEFADGWIPLGKFGVTAAGVDRVRDAVMEARGRRIEIVVYEPATDVVRLRQLRDLGCDKVVIRLQESTNNAVRAELEDILDLIEAI